MTEGGSERPRLGGWSLRKWLIQVHNDLFTIHECVQERRAHHPRGLTNLEKMTIVLEDRRFPFHAGVDGKAVVRELARAITFRRHGGASTIDMQFVRTCTGYKARTMRRKIYEILLSVLIQFRYSKRVILRSYLASAFFGSKLKGSAAAAMKLFGKPAEDLSLDEAAFLAAMLVSPRPLVQDERWRSRVHRRAQYGMSVYIRHKQRFDQFAV